MARISQTTELVEYNGDTGEVTRETKTTTTNWGTEPDYIKLYLQDVLYLSDLPTQYASALMAIVKRVTYAGDDHGMCLILAPMIRDDMCKELGLKNRQSLANVLQKLVKGQILFHVGRGVYRLNPYLFGRGTWADIAKIRMEVNYYPQAGRTFAATVEYAEKTAREAKAQKAARASQEAQEEPLPGQTTLEAVTGPTEATEAAQGAEEAKAS